MFTVGFPYSSRSGPPSNSELRDQIKRLNEQLEHSQSELDQITSTVSLNRYYLSTLKYVFWDN